MNANESLFALDSREALSQTKFPGIPPPYMDYGTASASSILSSLLCNVNTHLGSPMNFFCRNTEYQISYQSYIYVIYRLRGPDEKTDKTEAAGK